MTLLPVLVFVVVYVPFKCIVFFSSGFIFLSGIAIILFEQLF